MLRTAAILGLDVAPPPAHPFNPLLALRCAALVDDHHDGHGDHGARKRAIDALSAAVWRRGPGVTEHDVVARVLHDAGFDGTALVERASSEPAKARVRANTDRALADGAFGVPSIVVDGELFWGFDSFAHLERRLRGQDPIDGVDFAQWANLPAQSVRKAAR